MSAGGQSFASAACEWRKLPPGGRWGHLVSGHHPSHGHTFVDWEDSCAGVGKTSHLCFSLSRNRHEHALP